TATSGDGRNCSLATTTASSPGALRKARRNRILARFAPRNESHLEKITVQEKTEKTASSARPATSSGLRWTIPQRSTCKRNAKGASKLNSSPNLKSIINDGGCCGKRRMAHRA